MTTLSKLFGLAAVSMAVAISPIANGQDYPNRAIKVVVPYQPGGSTDIVVRKLAELAESELGQAVVIENKAGAGATMGAHEIKGAKPDGYTLAIIPSPVFRMPHMQKTGYDPLKDFTYISMLSGYTLGVAVMADSPYKTWNDLVEATRADPGAINYGTASVGSASNVMMEQTASHFDMEWTHIPYKGETEVLHNMIGGLLDVYAGSSTVAPFVDSGQMRMLVTWGKERSALYPDTPTLYEIEPGLDPVYSPFGIAGPAGMDPEVVQRLESAFKGILESDSFKEMLVQYGQEPVFMDSEAYTEYAAKQYEIEKEVVKQLGLAN